MLNRASHLPSDPAKFYYGYFGVNKTKPTTGKGIVTNILHYPSSQNNLEFCLCFGLQLSNYSGFPCRAPCRKQFRWTFSYAGCKWNSSSGQRLRLHLLGQHFGISGAALHWHRYKRDQNLACAVPLHSLGVSWELTETWAKIHRWECAHICQAHWLVKPQVTCICSYSIWPVTHAIMWCRMTAKSDLVHWALVHNASLLWCV